MAITWAQARDKLRGRLWKSGTSGCPDSDCDAALHASILELEAARQWLWLELIYPVPALVAASDQIALPADFSAPRSLCFRRSSTQALDPPLERITLGRLRSLLPPNASTSTGTPSYYAIQGGKIFLDCAAPIGSSFELIYTARTTDDLTAAVSAGDTNATLQKQETAVIALAGHYLALNLLRNNDEATRKLAVYQRILARLEDTEDEQRGDLHGGFIVPDNYYQIASEGNC